jgi:hypothetical protein
MVAIPFPLSTEPGERPFEGAGRLINVYAEPVGPTARSGVVYHRVPGLDVFAETNEATFRGGLQVASTLYAAWEGTVKAINSSGTVSANGSLSGTDKVFFARNNNSTPQIAIVSGGGAFRVNGTSIASYPDSDVGSPNSVCEMDGWFFFTYGNGDCQASDLNSTNINTLNKIKAESVPGGLTRGFAHESDLYLMGPGGGEMWSYPVNDSGFPLNRAFTFTPGLAGKYAVAGFEKEFGNYPIYVGSDNSVRDLSTSVPQKISPPDLDRLIAAVSDKNTLIASAYISAGFAFWQLSSPDWTWVYCLNTRQWHERESYLLSRSRMDLTVPAFGKWLTGDTQSGDLFELNESARKEGINPLIATLESGPVTAFPRGLVNHRTDFMFTTGVGIAGGEDPIERDPQVEISYSDDGGRTYGIPSFHKLGRQAKSEVTVKKWRNGRANSHGRTWRVRVSDPVHFGFMGGDMQVAPTST